MRPTEYTTTTEYVASIVGPAAPTIYAVTVYPPIRQDERSIDGGFITLASYHTDCRDTHSWRARWQRAWRAWRGCPDTDVYWDHAEDLDATIAALVLARARAFHDHITLPDGS